MPSIRPDLLALEIPDAEYVVCDVETTGLNPERNRLTEIAMIKIADGEIVDRYQTLINPRQFIPAEITAFTGITNEMVYGAPGAEEVMPQARRFLGSAIFVGHNVKFDRGFVDATLRRINMEPLDMPDLCTCRLARRLFPKLKSKSLGSVAAHLGIRINHRHRAMGDTQATAAILRHLLPILREEFDVTTVADLLGFQYKPVFRAGSTPRHVARVKDTVAALPAEPGVYLFHDKRDRVIYVGKAKSLKDRVGSYFYHNVSHTRKVEELVRQVYRIEWETTGTELSALLTELKEIRRHQPRYNTVMKHERRFPFIRLDAQDPYPTIDWSYDLAEDGAEYFGPFSSRFVVESAIETMNRIFLLRECDGRIDPDKRTSPCLYYDIKRCGAPCAEIVTRDEYLREVSRARQFLQGKHEDLLAELRGRMEAHADALRFEEAAAVKARLDELGRVIRQQEKMLLPVLEQDMILVTPARRTTVEIHCLRGGKLAQKFVADQKGIDKKGIDRMLREIYGARQRELFETEREAVAEMRIIAMWCLAHREETAIVPVPPGETLKSVAQKVCRAIADSGKMEAEAPEKLPAA